MKRSLPARSLALLALTAAPAVALAQTAGEARLSYPDSRPSAHVDTLHGTPVADPYRWLEDVDAAETAEWVRAQNTLTFGYLGEIPERGAIRERLTELWDYPKYGAPWRAGDRLFWFENSGLQNQSVLYVQDDEKKEPRILLDPNALSADGTVALTTTAVTDDGKLLGYGISRSGSDWQEFHVRDVKTARDLPDTLRWIKFSGIAWTKDSKGFFYSRYDEPIEGNQYTSVVRNQKLYYHRLGTPQSEDLLILERPDQPEWGFGAEVTEDGQFVIIDVWQGTDERNRLYLIDLGNPRRPRVTNPIVRLFDDFDATYDYVGNIGSQFLVRTTLGAPRGRLIAFDLMHPQERHWRSIVREGDDALVSAELIGRRIVAEYLKDAHSSIRLFSPGGQALGTVKLPGLGTVGAINGRAADDDFFYTFTSFLEPTSVYRFDLKTRQNELVKSAELPVDVSRYETRQVFYTSKDGTRIPMFVTMRKDLPLDGNHPTLLYAYGGFNIPMLPSFSPATLVWLEMGGIYAVANLRGGGEYGEEWHEAGMFDRKQNVFDDFIAAAEFLVREGYTSPPKLAIQGGSNGGLLVGAAITQRPELFGAALPAVGVMDMLRFHKFTIGWAWASEYGSADDPEQFRTLLAYSPLHNLKPGTCYPATLVTTADHDDRVVPGHSFKFAAALQAAQGCANPALIRIESKAGHGAGKPTTKRIAEVADIFAFLVRELEMTPRFAGHTAP